MPAGPVCRPVKVWRLPGIHHDSGCIVLSGRASSLIIDPGTSWYQLLVQERVEGRLEDRAPVERILLTHRHFDHSGAAAYLADQWSVPVHAHEAAVPSLEGGDLFTTWASRYDSDMPPTATQALDLEERFDLGDSEVAVLPLPGHTSCSVGYHIPERGLVVAGDTVPKAGHPARWDLPTGALPDLVESVTSLCHLEPETLLCGHGDTMRGRTTIAAELEQHLAFLNERLDAGGTRPETWPRPAATASFLTPRPAWPTPT